MVYLRRFVQFRLVSAKIGKIFNFAQKMIIGKISNLAPEMKIGLSSNLAPKMVFEDQKGLSRRT